MLNKRAVIIVSFLAAIPLTAVLIAVATHSGSRKSLQTSRFLGQSRSKTSVITTATTHSQQQKEKSQMQPQDPWQGSNTKKIVETTTTATASIISTNPIVDDKNLTTPEVASSSPIVPTSTSDDAIMVSSSSSPQASKGEEISVSDEARKAGESLKELIVTAIKEAKDSAKGKGKRLKQQNININTTTDSKDIHSLGDNLNSLVGLFEETMTEIRKERYNQQIKLLESYRDLLQTHIKVIDARGRMANKLKPGA